MEEEVLILITYVLLLAVGASVGVIIASALKNRPELFWKSFLALFASVIVLIVVTTLTDGAGFVVLTKYAPVSATVFATLEVLLIGGLGGYFEIRPEKSEAH
jgi:hypothetical protein